MENIIKKLAENNPKETTREDEVFPILDSRLITTTKLQKTKLNDNEKAMLCNNTNLLNQYNIKVVDCGEYTQVYYYHKPKYKTKIADKTELELKKQKLDNLFEKKKEPKLELPWELDFEPKIEDRNIIRSKLSCQRIAKTNSTIWETFITLTIAENELDLKRANKKFNNFITIVRRHKKDFKYIAIPEFQKRGSVHYHLLTNISVDDETLIYSQEDNQKFKHIKYWKHGYTKVDVMKNDVKKIVGYISKYMTKDIDNRLFGHRRYLYSQNLSIPKSSYINTNEKLDNDFYQQKIQDKELIYQNEYINPYDNSLVTFLEFHKN